MIWRHRLDEAATLLLLDQYEEAAYHYFVLANDPAANGHVERREALFYLGESLFLQKAWRAALPAYVELAAGEGDASYKQESNVRIVEISSAIGDDVAVDRAWKRFVSQAGGVTVEPQVAYALAKSYYRRGDLARADDVFGRIDLAGSKGRQSRYFRAVIALARSDRAAAESIFAEISALPAEGRERLALATRARMALARLRYSRREYGGAATAYGEVPEASPERPDAVYEKAWAELKDGHARLADYDLDLFLIAFPDHALAPRVKLLRAKLALALSQDDDAREGFRAFGQEFQPVLSRVDEVLHAPDDAGGFLARINAAEGERGFARALPVAAAQAALARPALRRALAVTRGLEEEDGSLADGRALAMQIAEGLEDAAVAGLPAANDRRRLAWTLDLRAERTRFAILDGASRAGSSPVAGSGTGGATAADAARARVLAALDAIPEAQKAQQRAQEDQRARISLLRAEVYAARDGITGARSTAVAVGKYLRDTNGTGAPQDPLLGRASQSSVSRELAELAAREREVNKVLRELRIREAATRAATLSPREAAARGELDAALGDYQAKVQSGLTSEDASRLDRLASARGRIGGALEAITRDEKARVADAGARLAEENRSIAAETVAIAAARARALGIAGSAARAGLEEVRASLDGLLLRADLGILDVAWTAKDRESRAVEVLAKERDQQLEAVDRRFHALLPAEEEKP